MPSARTPNGGAASPARIEAQEGRAGRPTADERGLLARDDDRARRVPAGQASSAYRILIRVNDDWEAHAFEYRFLGLRAGPSLRPRRRARDTTSAPVGVPALLRADAWSRALRRTGEHRWGVHE